MIGNKLWKCKGGGAWQGGNSYKVVENSMEMVCFNQAIL